MTESSVNSLTKVNRLRMVLYPVMANRVLLNIRRTSDRTIKTNAISTLLFAPVDSSADGDELVQGSESGGSDGSSTSLPSCAVDNSVQL